MRAEMRSMVPALLFALAIPVAVEAQSIGDRLKKKVGIGGSEQQQETAAANANVYNENVVEITPEVLEHTETGLRTEVALRNEFAALLATYKTPEEYGPCTAQVAASPEGMKIFERVSNLPENTTAEQMQRAYAEMGEAMKALATKVCGPDPAEWPPNKRQERLAEIEQQAADAAGPATDLEPLPEHGPSVAFDDVLARRGMPLIVYQVVKERVVAYCRAVQSGVVQPGAAVQFPGSGNNIFWVYSATEAAAIAPQCAQLMPLLEQLQ